MDKLAMIHFLRVELAAVRAQIREGQQAEQRILNAIRNLEQALENEKVSV